MTFDEPTTEATKDVHRSVIADPRPLTLVRLGEIPKGETRKVPVSHHRRSRGRRRQRFLAAASSAQSAAKSCTAGLTTGSLSSARSCSSLKRSVSATPPTTASWVKWSSSINAFQKGLLEDDRMMELQQRFGFRLIPHTTNRNKADPDLGIPSMPMAMIRREITIPWADEESTTVMGVLLDQLHIWRPWMGGNRPGGGTRYVAGQGFDPSGSRHVPLVRLPPVAAPPGTPLRTRARMYHPGVPRRRPCDDVESRCPQALQARR